MSGAVMTAADKELAWALFQLQEPLCTTWQSAHRGPLSRKDRDQLADHLDLVSGQLRKRDGLTIEHVERGGPSQEQRTANGTCA